eukprot:2667857-Pyramimonas_sp.AAC.1
MFVSHRHQLINPLAVFLRAVLGVTFVSQLVNFGVMFVSHQLINPLAVFLRRPPTPTRLPHRHRHRHHHHHQEASKRKEQQLATNGSAEEGIWTNGNGEEGIWTNGSAEKGISAAATAEFRKTVQKVLLGTCSLKRAHILGYIL